MFVSNDEDCMNIWKLVVCSKARPIRFMKLRGIHQLPTALHTDRSTRDNLIVALEFVFQDDPYVLVGDELVPNPPLEVYVLPIGQTNLRALESNTGRMSYCLGDFFSVPEISYIRQPSESNPCLLQALSSVSYFDDESSIFNEDSHFHYNLIMETKDFEDLRGKKVMVTGGCGYIGSHAVWQLLETDIRVVVIDTLEFGKLEMIDPKLAKDMIGRELNDGELSFYQGNIGDLQVLEKIFTDHKDITGIINFAAYIEVGESVITPLKYYENNTATVIRMVPVLLKNNVRFFVQSSTAAVYGEILTEDPIDEHHPTKPINAYGSSKLMVEKILEDACRAHGLKYICFRYFNVCGAHRSGMIDQSKEKPTLLVPVVMQVAIGKRPSISIFGEDYPTRDGTCIRDYIDVEDLIRAHIMGLQYLYRGGEPQIINLGSSSGSSVKEVIAAAKKVTGIDFKVITAARREGDPAILIASNKKAKEVLGWEPKNSVEYSITNCWKYIQRKAKETK